MDRNGLLIATSDPQRMPEALRADPPIRWYPEGAMLGHLTGYIFKNKEGEISVPKDLGLEVHDSLREGKPLRTSIDLRIQRLAWEALEKRQLPGSMVVMDPRSGEVLAMASWPSYDPNVIVRGPSSGEFDTLLNDPSHPLQNRAVLAESPGSIAKVLVALAAAKADKIDRVIHCGPYVAFGNVKLRDWNQERNEDLGLSQAMRSSCNTYFIPLALEMGRGAISQIGNDFGFGGETAPPWPGRPHWFGLDEEEVENTTIDLAFAAIGQGQNRFSVLDTARIFSAVAGGQIRPPVFTAGGPAPGTVSLESLGIDQRELGVVRESLTGSMVKAVRESGMSGVIAGKTSTALAEIKDGQQSHSMNFACFAPVNDPEYVVAVRFTAGPREEPLQSGAAVAGPVAVDLVKRLLNREF